MADTIGIQQGSSGGLRTVNDVVVGCATCIASGQDWSTAETSRCNLVTPRPGGCKYDNYAFNIDNIEDVNPDDVFVDRANHDYRLKANSPARGAGFPSYMTIGAKAPRSLSAHSPTNVGMQT